MGLKKAVIVSVPSRTRLGDSYKVTIEGEGDTRVISCNCPAGIHDKDCWHKELVRKEAVK